MNDNIEKLNAGAVELLQKLISTPSFSREEGGKADLLEQFLRERGVAPQRKKHNVWAKNRHFDPVKPTILLNSHHDTVRPNPGWTRDPFAPDIADGKLYGLGSNDAGASLVSLTAAFLHFREAENLPFNLVFAATAEEEISGPDGIELLLPDLPEIACALVGEPTKMHMAIAEKGLMVLDGLALGQAGHAAREEGESALYKALDDISRLRAHRFSRVSDLLGPVKMSVTVINAGKQHNVVPDRCAFVVDVRVNECYTLEEVLAEIRGLAVGSELAPRSLRMRSSIIPLEHPLVRAGRAIGRDFYGSPTTSDKALMPFPALKIGPGDSARSHTADEFVRLDEIFGGVEMYVRLLQNVRFAAPGDL